MCTPSLAKQASAIAEQQQLPNLVEWIGKLPTAERLRCSCPPQVVIRPLSLAELKRRMASRRQKGQEADRPPTDCSNPFEVLLKRRRVESERRRLGGRRGSRPAAASGNKPHVRSIQLTLPQMMRKTV
ncbi:uncharacterized protein [Dermacentor andersoni]|uniref:uncharacterized protein n=1 Tax=Dermacentor andersoni TaxID=34620 RepID=UPI002417DDA2|nr:uncharacterized protein LOC126519618 [Dermacentor andersoni]